MRLAWGLMPAALRFSGWRRWEQPATPRDDEADVATGRYAPHIEQDAKFTSRSRAQPAMLAAALPPVLLRCLAWARAIAERS